MKCKTNALKIEKLSNKVLKILIQMEPTSYLAGIGCSSYFDGLVCWPGTAPGNSAVVDCFHIDAFAQALTGITENQEIGKEL